jgi:hypothetical protein
MQKLRSVRDMPIMTDDHCGTKMSILLNERIGGEKNLDNKWLHITEGIKSSKIISCKNLKKLKKYVNL